MKCALCGDKIDVEDAGVYGLNPETLRLATFHLWCGIVAYDDITPEQKERYLEKLQNIPEG